MVPKPGLVDYTSSQLEVPLLPGWRWRWSCRKPIPCDSCVSAGLEPGCCCCPGAETEALQTSHRISASHHFGLGYWPSASAPELNSWGRLRLPGRWSHSDVQAPQRWSYWAGSDRAGRSWGSTAGPWWRFGKAQTRWSPLGFPQTSSWQRWENKQIYMNNWTNSVPNKKLHLLTCTTHSRHHCCALPH